MHLCFLFQFKWNDPPCFEFWWIDLLNPPLTIPLNLDAAGRQKKHRQTVLAGKGRQRKQVDVFYSIFVKVEVGHNMRAVSNVYSALNIDMPLILLSLQVRKYTAFYQEKFDEFLERSGDVDISYKLMCETYSYKKVCWYDIRLVGKEAVLEKNFPKNRAKPAPPETTVSHIVLKAP